MATSFRIMMQYLEFGQVASALHGWKYHVHGLECSTDKREAVPNTNDTADVQSSMLDKTVDSLKRQTEKQSVLRYLLGSLFGLVCACFFAIPSGLFVLSNNVPYEGNAVIKSRFIWELFNNSIFIAALSALVEALLVPILSRLIMKIQGSLLALCALITARVVQVTIRKSKLIWKPNSYSTEERSPASLTCHLRLQF